MYFTPEDVYNKPQRKRLTSLPQFCVQVKWENLAEQSAQKTALTQLMFSASYLERPMGGAPTNVPSKLLITQENNVVWSRLVWFTFGPSTAAGTSYYLRHNLASAFLEGLIFKVWNCWELPARPLGVDSLTAAACGL